MRGESYLEDLQQLCSRLQLLSNLKQHKLNRDAPLLRWWHKNWDHLDRSRDGRLNCASSLLLLPLFSLGGLLLVKKTIKAYLVILNLALDLFTLLCCECGPFEVETSHLLLDASIDLIYQGAPLVIILSPYISLLLPFCLLLGLPCCFLCFGCRVGCRLSHVLNPDLGKAKNVLILSLVEVSCRCGLSGLNGLELDEGASLGWVHVDLLNVAVPTPASTGSQSWHKGLTLKSMCSRGQCRKAALGDSVQ